MTTPTNSPSPAELTAWDRDHNLHPWGGLGTWKQDEYQRLNTGDGVYLWVSEGKRFIDGPGGMWCVQIGYGREEMAEAIADLTSSGETLRANHLRPLEDGLVHKSQATLFRARRAEWGPETRAAWAALRDRLGL